MYLKFFIIVCLMTVSHAMEEDGSMSNATYINRLINYRHKLEKVSFDHTISVKEQAKRYEKYTKNIWEMLTLTNQNCKFIIDKEVTQVMLFLNTQSCDHYRGRHNPIALYLGQNTQNCIDRMKNDKAYAKHMTILMAGYAMRFAVINRHNSPLINNGIFSEIKITFEEWFNLQRKQQKVDQQFKDYVKETTIWLNKNMFGEVLSSSFDQLSDHDWENLVEQQGIISDVIAPTISLLDIWDDIFVAGGQYKGWDCAIGEFLVWSRDNVPHYKKIKDKVLQLLKQTKSQQAYEYIIPLTYSGVKNQEDSIKIEYSFSFPFKDSSYISQENSFYFYLIRKYEKKLLNHSLLSLNTDNSQRIKDHQTRVRLMQIAIGDETYNNMELFKEAAILGSRLAIRKMLHNKKDIEIYIKIAADQGDIVAQFYCGLQLDKIGGDKNWEKARIYYEMAILQGGTNAYVNYADLLLDGKGGKRDINRAVEYYQLSIKEGNKIAMYKYGCMLYFGQGIEADVCLARKYFEQAAQKRHCKSQYIYAKMLQNGEGGEKNLEEARTYYLKAANQGHVYANNNYAIMLYRGLGGSQDINGAKKRYEFAMNKGYDVAQQNFKILLAEFGNGAHIK